MAEGKTISVPESRYPWFKQQIDALAKKAKKLTEERIYTMLVGKHVVDEPTSKLHGTRMVEVFVACPEVRLNGWHFVAQVDHSQDSGNIVRVVPGERLPETFRDREPCCDHCGLKRRRRDTYVVRDEARAEYRQVGKSCLKDFTGHHSPEKIARLAELLALIPEIRRASFDTLRGTSDLPDHRVYGLHEYLLYVADAIYRKGWTSRSKARDEGRQSTSEYAETQMLGDAGRIPMDYNTNTSLVERALTAAIALGDRDNLTDYEHNIHVLANSPVIERRHIHMAASIVGRQWLIERNGVSGTPKANQHVGEVGKTLELDVRLVRTSKATYGTRHVFEDNQGNQIVWFHHNPIRETAIGMPMRISMRVKEHKDWQGRKQTVITHARMAK